MKTTTPVYCYHYHAITPLPNGGRNHSFGLLRRTAMIDSEKEYQSAFSFIIKTHKLKRGNTILTSITLLNQPSQS